MLCLLAFLLYHVSGISGVRINIERLQPSSWSLFRFSEKRRMAERETRPSVCSSVQVPRARQQRDLAVVA